MHLDEVDGTWRQGNLYPQIPAEVRLEKRAARSGREMAPVGLTRVSLPGCMDFSVTFWGVGGHFPW